MGAMIGEPPGANVLAVLWAWQSVARRICGSRPVTGPGHYRTFPETEVGHLDVA